MICHVIEYNSTTGRGKAIPSSRLTDYVSPYLALDFFSKRFVEVNKSYSFFPKDFVLNGKFFRLEPDYANLRPY